MPRRRLRIPPLTITPPLAPHTPPPQTPPPTPTHPHKTPPTLVERDSNYCCPRVRFVSLAFPVCVASPCFVLQNARSRGRDA